MSEAPQNPEQSRKDENHIYVNGGHSHPIPSSWYDGKKDRLSDGGLILSVDSLLSNPEFNNTDRISLTNKADIKHFGGNKVSPHELLLGLICAEFDTSDYSQPLAVLSMLKKAGISEGSDVDDAKALAQEILVNDYHQAEAVSGLLEGMLEAKKTEFGQKVKKHVDRILLNEEGKVVPLKEKQQELEKELNKD